MTQTTTARIASLAERIAAIRTECPWADTYAALALTALDDREFAQLTPAEVDEIIHTTQLAQLVILQRSRHAFNQLHAALGHRSHDIREGGRRGTVTRIWTRGSADDQRVTADDAIAEARRIPADTRPRGYCHVDTIGEALAVVDGYRDQMRDASEYQQAGDLEYRRRGGWTRYYRVNNANGHVHATTSCRTTYATTLWTWPTQLSGATDAEVVAAAGALTCLSCFPDVREEIIADRPIQRERFETVEQTAEREQREAEAAAKRDAKVAKGITADGSPLVVRFGGLTNQIRTERAAELRYVDCAFNEIRTTGILTSVHASGATDREAYIERITAERDEYAAAVETLAGALAWKRSTTVDGIRDALAAKVDKRVQRGY